jgi:ketosteroid isomerase-like protein
MTNTRSNQLMLLIVILFTGFGTHAQSTEQTKVNQSLTKLFDALAALDMNGIKSFSIKDLIILESGAVWNLDTLSHKIDELKAINFSRTNHLDFVQTEIKGNIAWVVYYNSADMLINGVEVHRKWLESAVLVKDSKEWKVRLLHSTTLKIKKE